MDNTIVILIDTLRLDHIGCYNAGEHVGGLSLTPAMDALAERGTRFEQAYVGSYTCMPARRDLWTGRTEFPFRGWGPLEPDDPDLFARLQAHGATTMLVTDHYHLWDPGSGNYSFGFNGWEFIRGQEYDRWITDPTIPIPWPAPREKLAQHCPPDYYLRYQRNRADFRVERDWFAPKVFQAATDWIERNHTRSGFSLLIDCFDPHEPFDPPPPYDMRFMPNLSASTNRVIWPNYGWSDLTNDELAVLLGLYKGELALTDRWLGYFLERLDDLDLFTNTTVVLTTDHGHLFGEHGLMGKPWSGIADGTVYEELAHVPLIVVHPAGKPGQQVDQLTQLVDVYATVLDAHGVAAPEEIEGHSLLPLARGEQGESQARSVACFGRFGEAMQVTDGEWTLVLWPPTEANGPLNWYSTLPPQFGAVYATGPLTVVDGRPAYPVTVARGDQHSALYHTAQDPRQQRNVLAANPEVVDRLTRELIAWLDEIRAPAEQFARMGLR